MHKNIKLSILDVMNELDQRLSRKGWEQILRLFEPTRIADSLQIQQYAGLDREKFRRSMDKIQSAAIGMPPIFRALDHSITRPGTRGRRPAVYLLGETGALLLKALGGQETHACQLNNDLAITHALAMLDVHQAALAADLEVLTDRGVEYSENQVLRPDHQISVPDCPIAIIEIEQSANKDNIARIRESLNHKRAFFKSSQANPYQREIRMLVNLASGSREYHDTLKRWRQTYNALSEISDMGFTLVSMSLMDFLMNPDWSVQFAERWSKIPPPQEEQHPLMGETPELVTARTYSSSHTAYEDAVIVNAACQEFIKRKLPGRARPDFGLLTLVNNIYLASHAKTNPWALAVIPHASIYGLKTLLEKRDELREQINRNMNRGRQGESPFLVAFHMQKVIDCFLRYYGWEPGPFLSAEAASRGYESASFIISVRSHLQPSSGDGWEQTSEINAALEWVLGALFKYWDEIGLDRPRFLS